MRDINWYNPEQNVWRAIARAQDRGDVVEPYGVPEWLLGVAPGTPALPTDAGQVSFRGDVRRPTYGQTVAATFGYADAGACNPCGQREAGALGDSFERVRLNFLGAASAWGWNVADINAINWDDPVPVRAAMDLLIGMVAELCGTPYDTAKAALTNAAFSNDPTALSTALNDLNTEFCPELRPAVPPQEVVQVVAVGDDCPAGERMTEIPVYVNGRQVGTSMICAPMGQTVVPPATDEADEKKKKKGYPVWGYYVAGVGALLVVGGVAYYGTRNR